MTQIYSGRTNKNILGLAMLWAAFFLRFFLDGVGYGAIAIVPLLLLFLLSLHSHNFRSSPQMRRYILISVLVIFMGCIVAVWRHDEWTFQFFPVLRYVTYMLIAVTVYTVKPSIGDIVKLLGFMVWSQVAIACFQMFFYGDSRPDGTLVNNNHIMYDLAILFAVYLLYYDNLRASLLVFVSALILGGIGGLATIVITFFLYIFLRKGMMVRAVVIVPIFLAFGLVSSQAERLQEILSFEYLEIVQQNLSERRYVGAGSLGWRVVNWALFLDVVREQGAVLTGVGIDASSERSPYFVKVARGQDPHSDYVRLTVDFGVIVATLYVALVLSNAVILLRRYRKSTERRDLLAGGLLGVLLLSHLAGNTFVQSTFMWFVIAIVTCCHAQNRRSSLEQKPDSATATAV